MKKLTSPIVLIALLSYGCGSSGSHPSETKEQKPAETPAPATDLSREEKWLVGMYNEVMRTGIERKDSTEWYANRFADSLRKLVEDHPGSLQYPFKLLRDSSRVYVETAPGGRFRAYSWDTWTGGTMHYFDGLWQWQGEDGVKTAKPKAEDGDPGSFCSGIYTVHIHNREYYLAILNGVYSSKDVSQSIQAFTIEGNQLVDTVTLFNTGSKRLNRIDVNYDFFSVVDRPERPVKLISYDEKNKELHIPVVNDKGQVGSKNLVYELKEDGFVFRGVE